MPRALVVVVGLGMVVVRRARCGIDSPEFGMSIIKGRSTMKGLTMSEQCNESDMKARLKALLTDACGIAGEAFASKSTWSCYMVNVMEYIKASLDEEGRTMNDQCNGKYAIEDKLLALITLVRNIENISLEYNKSWYGYIVNARENIKAALEIERTNNEE